MVKQEKFARAEALFREPPPPDAVQVNSDSLQRRLAPARASSDEASHEARPQRAPASLPVHPQTIPAPRVGGGQASSDVPSPKDYPSQRWPADADGAASPLKEVPHGFAFVPLVRPPAPEAALRHAEAQATLVRLLVRRVLAAESRPARKAA